MFKAQGFEALIVPGDKTGAESLSAHVPVGKCGRTARHHLQPGLDLRTKDGNRIWKRKGKFPGYEDIRI